MKNSDITDPVFREAVKAIDTGNTSVLKDLLEKNPRLLHEPLDTPNERGYFNQPYLLWFIADNPIRNDKLPANIIEVTRLIIDKLKQETPANIQHQLNYTLGLVATGRIPRECGVQIGLIDLLIDSGAQTGSVLGALAHGNIDAAKHLINKGGKLDLAAAVCLDRTNDITRLASEATIGEKQIALTAAAFYGKADMIAYLLNLGANPDAYLENADGFHSHATALHQAVYSGSLESVKLLVGAGANLDLTDKIYGGTPLGWAMHMQTEDGYDKEAKKRFKDIEDYLLQKEKQ